MRHSDQQQSVAGKQLAHRPRSRRAAKAAGTALETAVAGYLAEHVDDRIERRRQSGAKDRGDISGVRTVHNGRVVIECKSYAAGQIHIGTWLSEADIERGNDDAIAGLVVAKRRGVTDPGSQVVFMTLRDLAAILTGNRPEDTQ